MELTMKDRLIIANQLKILERLCPEDADYYTQHRKAIEGGYKLHYSWLVEHFSMEMSMEECKEVLDILDMYRAITFSYKKLENKTGIDESRVRFRGFDGNNEGKQHSYALYFIVDLGRFEELRNNKGYTDFNSHMPVLEKYRRMLQLWQSYDNKQELNRAQLLELIGP
jgi:uncharacterized protein